MKTLIEENAGMFQTSEVISKFMILTNVIVNEKLRYMHADYHALDTKKELISREFLKSYYNELISYYSCYPELFTDKLEQMHEVVLMISKI